MNEDVRTLSVVDQVAAGRRIPKTRLSDPGNRTDIQKRFYYSMIHQKGCGDDAIILIYDSLVLDNGRLESYAATGQVLDQVPPDMGVGCKCIGHERREISGAGWLIDILTRSPDQQWSVTLIAPGDLIHPQF